MRSTQQLTITLPTEMARLVKARVSDGSFQSESDVVGEGLRLLQERDGALEDWLSDKVAAAYDAHKAAPEAAASLNAVKERLEARHAAAAAEGR